MLLVAILIKAGKFTLLGETLVGETFFMYEGEERYLYFHSSNIPNANCLTNHSTNEVKILLCKVAEGDENACGQLFEIYYNQLGAFIQRITECEQLTKEIVQDVFLKVWTRRSSLSDINCFHAYLIVMARDHAFNCLKQIARKIHKKRMGQYNAKPGCC